MIQIIETTDKEKYDMYNLLDKDILIGMLIECNKHLQRLTPKIDTSCNYYMAGTNSSCNCSNCGKPKYLHQL